jgi:hypothetical protein
MNTDREQASETYYGNRPSPTQINVKLAPLLPTFLLVFGHPIVYVHLNTIGPARAEADTGHMLLPCSVSGQAVRQNFEHLNQDTLMNGLHLPALELRAHPKNVGQ